MAAPTPFDPVEMPLQDKRRLTLHRALTQNPSYYQLSLRLSSHASELAAYSTLKTRKAEALLSDDIRHKHQMLAMLHTIPREYLEAIILGTVAHYFRSDPSSPPPCYDGLGPGTYVAALSIRGRQGHFLSVDEIEELIRGLKKYCVAYGRYCISGNSPVSVRDVELADFTRRVDDAYGFRPASAPDSPRWITSDTTRDRVLDLATSLRRRCDSSLQGAARTTPQKQGPLMVGCSNDLAVRMPQHRPENSSGLRSTTCTWGLTLCLIREHLGLDPEVTVRPVVRTWDNSQLPASEILVSALAASYVFQDGFNIVGAGGRDGDVSDQDVLLESKRTVFVLNPWFQQNYKATMAELEEQKAWRLKVRQVAEFPSSQTNTLLRKVDAGLSRLRALGLELDQEVAKAKQYLEDLRKLRKQKQKRLDQLDDIVFIQGVLLDAYRKTDKK
ncbi:hypothetical protein GGR56DRAFT_698352 [Xylariaceae sp. FL0804]|nr:hypothetical protein GGR56DRAFT_698352 [Xylariaceae sp. FL0804]